MKQTIIVAAFAIFAGTASDADIIERACLGSDRGQGQQALCGCIQQVADVTLTRRDQRVAAAFFADPHKAQEMRTSSRPSHGVFWSRWRSFGEAAEGYCS